MLRRRQKVRDVLVSFMSALAARFGWSRPVSDPPQLVLAAPRRFEDWLSIPVHDHSIDDVACRDSQRRGQFLARQDRWDDLTAEIREADTARQSTPGGMPIAELMAFGARSDVISAVEHALQDNRPADDMPLTDGIKGLEAIRREHPDDPFMAAIVALAHIDIGWAWRGGGRDASVTEMYRNKCAAHFDRANSLLSPYCGIELDSPLMASARCALLAGLRDPGARIADDYEDLIDLNPRNHRPMRALGTHLLPRWFGSYDMLELEARRTASRTQDIWGAGGYSWVCFDAIAQDERACALVDVDFFIDGLRDIVARRPEQEMINLLAAYCSVAMRHGQGASTSSDLPRMQIVDCANWLIRDHLTEIHPMIWAHASDGFDNNTRVTSVSRFAARGRADAMQVIAEQFRDDIDRGIKVIFTPNGPELHPS